MFFDEGNKLIWLDHTMGLFYGMVHSLCGINSICPIPQGEDISVGF